MDEIVKEVLPQKRENSNPLFVLLYLIGFGYLLWDMYPLLANSGTYSENELISASYIWVTLFAFSFIGVITVRYAHSFLYALSAALIGFVAVSFFYQSIWPIL